VTYLAYAGTSGLQTMDYRFTDPYLDPEGEDGNYVEKSIRLKSYWCYAQPHVSIEGSPISNQFITFGCLNSFSKVSDAALATWKRVLDATPKSRLLLFAAPGKHRDVAAAMLRAERVEFVGQQSLADYLRTYNRIDIALDPFPYVGGTTSCDALWMGVPVVTLGGRTAVGRGGVSLLSQLQLTDLIARTEEDYIATATRLAGDLKWLGELRSTLRPRMLASPLCNAQDFARDVEERFRQIWRDWCGRRTMT
jgi:protein O-GlcNAc transferase